MLLLFAADSFLFIVIYSLIIARSYVRDKVQLAGCYCEINLQLGDQVGPHKT